MTNIKMKILAAVIIAVLAGAAMYYFKGGPANDYFSNLFGSPTSKPAEVGLPSAENQKTSESQNVYKNEQYGFSFGYPEGFNVSDFDEGNGKVILVKKAASDNGFQIFISPFDESGPITKERILKDIPDMIISNEKEILVGGEKALSFTSKDELGLPAGEAGGETREIWFVRSENLYQISAFSSFEKELLKILATWKF